MFASSNKTVAEGDGHYLFQFLPPGTYSVRTHAAGFKSELRDDVRANQRDHRRGSQRRVPGHRYKFARIDAFLGLFTTGTLSGTTVQRAQLLRPYPQYTSVTCVNPMWGKSMYHSLRARYQKAMGRGLTTLVAYTFSKNLNNLNTLQNIYNRTMD